jgi:hypothetical protein
MEKAGLFKKKVTRDRNLATGTLEEVIWNVCVMKLISLANVLLFVYKDLFFSPDFNL